jgi:hypothetical protein
MLSFLENEGYFDVRNIDGKWYGLRYMLFTVGVFCDCDKIGPQNGRICFDTLQNAKGFYLAWDGKTDPVVGVDGCKADKRKKINRRLDDYVNKLLKKAY